MVIPPNNGWINLRDLKLEQRTSLTVVLFGFKTSLLTKTIQNILETVPGFNQEWFAVYIDLDENQEAFYTFNIRLSPYLIYFREGKMVGSSHLPLTAQDICNAVTTHQSS